MNLRSHLCNFFVAAGLLAAGQAHALTAGPIPVPVTNDGSCEFGFKASTISTWENPEIGWSAERFGQVMLGQVLKHCAPGAVLTIGYAGKGSAGVPHDQYSVAALLCRRPEIQEQSFSNGAGYRPGWMFTCRIDRDKFDKLLARQQRGEPLWNRKDEFVAPRPGDDVAEDERLKALGLRQPSGGASRPLVSPPIGNR